MRFLKSFLRRLFTENISFLAGGVAFYGMLALFPAMAGIVSLFGLTAAPHLVAEQLDTMQSLFPPNVYKIIQEQLMTLIQQPAATLSFTVLFSILLTIYSATKGTRAMLAALQSVFSTEETRSWFFQQIQAYALTFGALLLMVLAVFSIVALPILFHFLAQNFDSHLVKTFEGLRWFVLALAIFMGLFILFAFGPNRHVTHAKIRPIFWGAFIATSLWIATAVGGSILIQLVPKVNAAYGSISAIIALMMWIYISAYIVLIGGAFTAVAEQTRDF